MKNLFTSILICLLLPLLSKAQSPDFNHQASATTCGEVTLLIEQTSTVGISQWLYGASQRLVTHKGNSKDTLVLSNLPTGWMQYSITAIGANGQNKLIQDSVYVPGTSVFHQPSMDLAFCDGESGSLDIASNLTSATPIEWIVDGSTITQRSFNDTQDKTYRVASSNGTCSDTLQVNVDVIKVAPSFIVTSTSGSNPLTVTFQSTSEEDADEFEWKFGLGALQTDAAKPIFTYNSPGTYDVTLYTSKSGTGCKDSVTYFDFINVFPTSLDEFNSHTTDIYPNPSTGSFTINNSFGSDLDVIVYSSNGKEVFRRQRFSGNQQIDLSEEEPGVYLLHLQNGTQSMVQRLTLLAY